MGTSGFAEAILRRLADSRHRPALVVAPPDRPRGRGRRLAPPPVAAAARELGLEVIQTDSVNRPQAADAVLATAPDVGVVCAFGQLIGEPLLSEVELLNIHPSLLPRWRGAAPIERALMAGDAETGVTVMRVGAGLDSGPIALQERTPIAPGEGYGELEMRLREFGGELILEALELRDRGELRYREQDDSLATYAEKIAPEDRRLDPRRSAVELERVVRALNPHVGTYVELDDGQRLGVRAAVAESGRLVPGELSVADGGLRLGCAEAVLRLDVVQPTGGRPMPADAYLRGHAAPARAR